MRLHQGLLNQDDKDPVKLDGLLSNAWGGVSKFFTGILDVDPELQARRDARDAEIYESRAQSPFFQALGWGEGNDERSGNWLQNLPESIGQMYRDGAYMATNPGPSTEAIASLLAGGVLNLTPVGGLLSEDVGVEQREMANQFGSYLTDTFGSWEGFKEEFRKNPAEIISMAVGAGFGVKALTKVATNPAVQAKFMNEMNGIVAAANQGHYGMQSPLITWQGNNRGAIFRQLDMDAIGSNSGTMVQGWGQYVSGTKHEGKRYARHDADMLDEFDELMKLEKDPLIKEILDRAASGYYPDTIRADVIANLTDPADIAKANKALYEIEGRFDTADNQLYEIDLSDDAIKTFINREAKKADQNPMVQKEMERLGLGDDATGQTLYDELVRNAMDMNQPAIVGRSPGLSMFDLLRRSQKAASLHLNSLGIKGMSFTDRFTSARNLAAGQDAGNPRNYVLYSDDTTKILKRQDIDIDKNTQTAAGVEQGILTLPLDEGSVRLSNRVTEQRALAEGTFDKGGTIVKGENNIIIPDIDLRNLEGFPYVATYADLSRAGGYLTHVNGTKFPNPVKLEGGQDFMIIPENVDRGVLWASHRDAISSIIRQAGEAKQMYGKDPIYLPFRMSPTGLDFSHQVVDSMLQSALQGLNRSQKTKLDKMIRTQSKDLETGKNINQKWKGIDAENPLLGSNGAERKAIARIIDVNFRDGAGIYTKGADNGVLSWTKARLANTDHRQLNKQEGTLQNVGQIELNSTDHARRHTSYDSSLPGAPVGILSHDLHISDLNPIIASGGQRAGQRITREGLLPNETRQINTSNHMGLISHEMLMRMEKQGLFN
jgi:hypothetical protein